MEDTLEETPDRQSHAKTMNMPPRGPVRSVGRFFYPDGSRADDGRHPPVHAYDFRNPTLLTEVEMRQLRQQNEQFVHYLAARLAVILRMDVELSVEDLSTLPFEDFTGMLPSPAFITLFKVEELSGIGVLQIDPVLAMAFVDRLLGGKGQAGKESRYLTEIEVALLEDVIRTVTEEWARQWSEIMSLRPLVLNHENNGRFLQTSANDALTLSTRVNFKLSDHDGYMQLGLPYQMLEPLIQKSQSQRKQFSHRSGDMHSAIWRDAYDDIRATILAEWDCFSIPTASVLRLRKGDILMIPEENLERTKIRLHGEVRFEGEACQEGDFNAVRITRHIHEKRQ